MVDPVYTAKALALVSRYAAGGNVVFWHTGGLLDVAIDIAKRFIPNGNIIVSTVHHDPKQSMTYRSQNSMPLAMPWARPRSMPISSNVLMKGMCFSFS